jgi:beta-lactamase regulating signal transducer with metallopeptidase domain
MSDSVILLVKATALLVLAMGISMSLRRAPAGARYLVWLATLVALLLVPAMSAWSPLPLRVLPSEPANQLVASTPSPTTLFDRTFRPQSPPGLSDRSLQPQSPTAVANRSSRPLSTTRLLLLAWLGVVALVLAWLALGAFTVRRIVAKARTLTDASWLDPLYETADRLDLEQAPRLVMSSRIEMPFACGILRPTVVLPASAEQWSDERRRVVLFHELAHIKRRDLVGHTVGRLVCAVYWFHPLVWSAAKQLRAESERACDDLVLACGARASDYANHLLEIVTSVRRQGAPAMALPMANRREFEGRMLAILDPAVKRTTPNRAQRLLLTLGFGTVALSIAAVAPVRRQPELLTRHSERSEQVPASAGAVVGQPQIPRFARDDTARDSSIGGDSVQPRLMEPPVVPVQAAPRAQSADQQGPQPRQPSQSPERSRPDTALLARILRTDESDDVRKSATWVLNGRRDGVPLLLERLRGDASEDVREMAAWGLAGFTSDAVTSALAEALRKDRDAEVRGTAAWALGHTRGRETDALEAALGDQDAEVRRKALWALGHSGLEAVPARAVAALKDDDSDVRIMAAWLLTEIMDRSALPAIREAFLKETHRDAQESEFRALLFMGDRSKEVIDRAMASDHPDLRARAVRMIAGHGPGVWPWPWPWPDPRPYP